MLIGQVRSIRVLCAIAEHGSFSAAARSLGMTQSAVSQHVALLERETLDEADAYRVAGIAREGTPA